MRTAPPRFCPRTPASLLACSLLALPIGCDAIDSVDTSSDSIDEAFRAFEQSARLGEFEEMYVVEGDILIEGEDELRDYFDGHVDPSDPSFRSVAFSPGGEDIFVPSVRKLNLSYCVDNDFNGQHDRVREKLRIAASKWEAFVDVNFVHRPEFDHICDASELGLHDVSFAVKRFPYTGWGFSGLAFFPTFDDVRTMLISDDGLDDSDDDLEYTMRHELGHILGRRHEHIGFAGCGPEPDTERRELTPRDRESVMWTQFVCNSGEETPPLGLSRYDVLGAYYQYNLPTFHQRMKVVGSEYIMQSDIDSDGYSDALFVSDTPGVVTVARRGQPDGTFESAVELGPYSINKDKRPFFGRFSDSFGLSADVFELGHNTALDRIVDSIGDSLAAGLDSEPIEAIVVPLAGDFDGNGFTDLLHYQPGSGSDELWLFDADGLLSKDNRTINGYYWPLVGDFNADGRDDVLWYDPVGTSHPVWTATGHGRFESTRIGADGTGLATRGSPYRPMVGDFDGDRDDDIFWYRPGVETDRLWLSDDGPIGGGSYSQTVNGIYRPVLGDFDGDGSDDIFWYGQGDWSDSLWYMNGNSHEALDKVDKTGDLVPFVGDFNGDRDDDIMWYDPNRSTSSVWFGAGRHGFKAETTATASHAYLVGFGPSTR